MLARARTPVLRRILIPITAAISTLLSGLCQAQGVTFEGNGVARAGNNPRYTAIADLNGDGHPEIVVADATTAGLRIFLGGPDGPDPFGAAVPTLFGSVGLVVVDVDNDGDRDIVTANSGGVCVVRNIGSGTFAAPVMTSVGSSLRALAAGDIDGDGDVDFAVANYSGTAFSAQLLFNQGNGTFGAPLGMGTVGGYGDQILLGDIDGDGDPDLLLHENNFGAIRVQRNLGGGSFGAPVYYAASGIDALTLGDVDGDNDPDMLFIDHLQLVLMRNQGGVFSLLSSYVEPAYTMGITVADLDSDGDPDLALAGYSSVRILLSSGGGVFPWAANVVNAGNVLFAIAAADLDLDADPDLVVTSLGGGSVTWLWNHGDATFDSGTQLTGCPQAASVALGDLNGNGIPDAVTTGVGSVAVYLDPSTSPAGPPTSYPFYEPSDARLADLDGDGDRDVVFVQGAGNAVTIGWNQGNGVLAQSSTFPLAGIPICVRTGDLDGDGDLDLVVANYNGSTMCVLMNLGMTQFSAPTFYPTAAPQWMELGDLDGDLDLDLAVMNTSSNTVSIFSNTGNGTFGPATILAMPGYKVAVADLDGDGDLDLATGFAVGQTSGVNFSQNTGGGAFAAPVQLPGLPAIYHIFATDLDHDGDQDLIGTNINQQAILWMQNLGGANFVQMPSISMPVTGLALGDVDVDGDIDLVTAHIPSNGIAIVRNCLASGHVICTGDGSATNCPCGNMSAPGAGSGCLNSTGAGATIRADGPAGIAHDRLVLRIDGMPSNTLAMFLQGSSAESAGAGVVFGDGLRCVGGSLIRLGVEFATQGSASYPGADGAGLSTVGPIGSGDERVYQAWYRNGTSFCTPSAFNLTNGIVVRWGS